LANADALRCAVELLADEFVGKDVDLIAGCRCTGIHLGCAGCVSPRMRFYPYTQTVPFALQNSPS
jgi:adenine/guanine phosphoribosyltransferase-like PRPP-binding protein